MLQEIKDTTSLCVKCKEVLFQAILIITIGSQGVYFSSYSTYGTRNPDVQELKK